MTNNDVRNRKNYKLKVKYGITIDQYEDMLEKQGGVCAICHKSNGDIPLGVDHDHETGKVRGLLCNKCNLILGMIKDDIDLLIIMEQYLESYL